jgi:hypothetical protein
MIRKMTVVICRHLSLSLGTDEWRWTAFSQALQVPAVILSNGWRSTSDSHYIGPDGLRKCLCVGDVNRNRVNCALHTSTRIETFVELGINDGVRLTISFYRHSEKEPQLILYIQVGKDGSVYTLGYDVLSMK